MTPNVYINASSTTTNNNMMMMMLMITTTATTNDNNNTNNSDNDNDPDNYCSSSSSLDPFIIKTGISYFILNFAIAVFGTYWNASALWCLSKCDKTSVAAKIQLMTFFSFQFLVCALSLPGFSYVKLMALLCRAHELSRDVKLFFLFSHTVFLPMERMNFAVMAVMRLFAVRWNRGYKRFVQTRNVVILELFIFAFVISPWIVSFFIGLYKRYPIEEQMTVSFSFGKSPAIQGLYLIHAINHLFPTFVSFIAYSLMMYTMIKKKMMFFGRAKTRTSKSLHSTTVMENVAYTIRLLILVNILLDLPHTLSHLLKVSQIPSLIIHSIFYSHLTFDPLIFVGMNIHYRNLIGIFLRGSSANINNNNNDNKKNKGCCCCCRSIYCPCCDDNNNKNDDVENDYNNHPISYRAVVLPSEKGVTSTITIVDSAFLQRHIML